MNLGLFQYNFDIPPLHSVGERDLRFDAPSENGGVTSPRFMQRIRNTGTGAACTAHAATSSPQQCAHTRDNSAFERQFIKTLQKVYQTIDKNEIRLAEQDRRDVIKNDWQQVGIVVDRLLLAVFVVITLGMTLGLLLTPPHGLQFFSGGGAPGVGE